MAAMSLTRVLVVVLLSALAVSSAPTHPSARDGNPTAIPGGNPTAIPGGADGIAGADAAVTPLDEGADAGLNEPPAPSSQEHYDADGYDDMEDTLVSDSDSSPNSHPVEGNVDNGHHQTDASGHAHARQQSRSNGLSEETSAGDEGLNEPPVPEDDYEANDSDGTAADPASAPMIARRSVIDSLVPSDRASVARAFTSHFAAGEPASKYSGDPLQCLPGHVSSAYKQYALERLNLYRGLSGLPPVGHSDADAAICQEAATMFAHRYLSHTPAKDAACYTPNAYEAAGRANIGWGRSGARSIDQYIDDAGAYNAAVGHRRWFMWPRLAQVGLGFVDVRYGYNGLVPSSCAVVFSSTKASRPDGLVHTGWPPVDAFVPRPMMPTRSWRWDYSRNGADFASATASVKRVGEKTERVVRLEPVTNGYGDNTLVFVVDDERAHDTAYAADQAYNVIIRNIGGGGPAEVAYKVTVINPDLEPTPAATNVTFWLDRDYDSADLSALHVSIRQMFESQISVPAGNVLDVWFYKGSIQIVVQLSTVADASTFQQALASGGLSVDGSSILSSTPSTKTLCPVPRARRECNRECSWTGFAGAWQALTADGCTNVCECKCAKPKTWKACKRGCDKKGFDFEWYRTLRGCDKVCQCQCRLPVSRATCRRTCQAKDMTPKYSAERNGCLGVCRCVAV